MLELRIFACENACQAVIPQPVFTSRGKPSHVVGGVIASILRAFNLRLELGGCQDSLAATPGVSVAVSRVLESFSDERESCS